MHTHIKNQESDESICFSDLIFWCFVSMLTDLEVIAECVHTNMAKNVILHVYNMSVFRNANIGYCRSLQYIINVAILP